MSERTISKELVFGARVRLVSAVLPRQACIMANQLRPTLLSDAEKEHVSGEEWLKGSAGVASLRNTTSSFQVKICLTGCASQHPTRHVYGDPMQLAQKLSLEAPL